MLKTLKQCWWTPALLALVLVAGCKKKPAEPAKAGGADAKAPAAAAKTVVGAANTAAGMTTTGSTAKVLDLGFASHLPASTEVYFSTIGLPANVAALKESNYFKDVTAFLDDRVPAPSVGAPVKAPERPKAKAVEKLLGNDFFIAMGKGTAKSLAAAQELSSLYTELVYRGIMSGTKPGMTTAKGAPNPAFAAMFKDPDFVKRAVDAWANVELPPLMFGIRSDKPEQTLKELLPDDALASVSKKAKISKVSTTLSGQFTLVEATGKDVLNEEMKKGWLAMLPPESAAVAPDLDRLFAAFQAKKFSLAYGTAGGYVIVALGSERPDLQFLTNPAASLASRPELGALNTYQTKKFGAVVFAEGTTLQAMQSPEPLQPMVRGILSGLKQSPVFAAMAKALEPKVATLSPIERKIFAKPLTTLVGAAWWDKGLHVETDGGLSPKGLEGKKALKFAALLDDPNVVMATDYHSDPQSSADMREYVEGLADVLHTAGQELVKANMFGDQGAKMSDWIELEIIPQVVAFYAASKTVFTKGVGNEHAMILDLGGRLPALPGMANPDPKAENKMLRFAQVNEVQDRAAIGENWSKMEAALNGIAKAFPMAAGQKLPEVETSNKGGVTCYFYPSPVDSDDIVLTTAVSDKLFLFGTSKSLEEDLATRLLRVVPSTVPSTMFWRVNWPKVREAIKTFSPAGPAATTADNVKASSKWLAPLGEMRGRQWLEAGHVRNSLSWEIKDTKNFD